jgi:hypothetical protein
MAATTEQLRGAIDIGSLPFGQRQAFESSLGEIGAATPAATGARGAQDPGSLGLPSNPLDPLLSGELPVGDDPLTSGLSAGPGPGPLGGGISPITDNSVDRLRILALNAKSPQLRLLARRALRGSVREYRSA